MSKVARIVAKVASVVAIVAAVAAAVTGNPALAALLLKVSAVAGAVGAVAGTVAQMTAKKPPARGSPNLITIGANQPMPIVLGETYIGGNKVHEVGYGGLVAKVQNPYKFEAIIHSGCGPVEAITGLYADFASVPLSGTAATGYFAGFLYADQQLGARPESNQLAPNWSGAPDWTSAHKLSGYAATGLSLKFDKDGKVFASGEPQWGVTLQGVKAYDPRLDSTYPGGSGTQRIDDRSTWVYSDNPGIVGLTYAYGWFHDGKKQGGIGMPVEGIDLARWVEFANVCDANAWVLGGVVYEPGSRWDNLKDICAAGGGEPYFDRHLLGVNYNAPRVSLDTITADDIADDGFTVASGRTWRERLNTIAPKFRSGAHKWEYVPSEDMFVADYITDDGEEKREEITWNLVQDKDQVAQLAAYELVNRREIGQIEVSCKPRLMRYTVGDMLTFDLPGTVIDGLDAIIIRPPEINPETGQVKLIMLGETDAKHAFALGKTGTAPPVPSLLDTEDADNVTGGNLDRVVSLSSVPSITFAADYTGVIDAGLLPTIISPSVTMAGASIKLDDATHYAISTSGVTATVENTDGELDKGNVEITAVSANSGFVDLTVTVGANTYPPLRTVIAKNIGLPPGFGGAGSKIASDNSFTAIGSTSYVAITDVLTITVASGESLYGTAPLDYIPATGGSQVSRTATMKWQRSPVGAGTWTDFGSGIVGTTSTSADDGEPEYGHCDCIQTATTPGAADYDIRLVALLSASGRNVSFTGTATVEAKV
jgi:hypothetical protein